MIALSAFQAVLAVVGGIVATTSGCIATFYLVRREQRTAREEGVQAWKDAIADVVRDVTAREQTNEVLRAERAARVDERIKAMADANDKEFRRLSASLGELTRSLQSAWRRPPGKTADGES